MKPDETDANQVIEDFLSGDPRAKELQEMTDSLEARFQCMKKDLEFLPEGSEEKESMQESLKEMKKQIMVLRREQMITQFVEDSVKISLNANGLLNGAEDLEL